jgi:hypothetical protein
MLFYPRRLARSWIMRYGPLTEDQMRNPWQRILIRFSGAIGVAYCLRILWGDVSALLRWDSSVIREVEDWAILQADRVPDQSYWYLSMLLGALILLMVLWVFLYNGIRMLIGPEKWMSTSWMARVYCAKLQGKVAPWQWRLVGLVWAAGATAVLVTVATRAFR